MDLESILNSPTLGLNPLPVTSYTASPQKNDLTDISFLVSVPVLSVQIIVAEPRVSTTFILEIIAFLADMFCIPSAKVITRIIGSPSGTIATKITTAIRNCSDKISLSIGPVAPPNKAITMLNNTNTIAVITAIMPRNRPSEANLISNGVLGVSTCDKPDAISPSLVCIPVLITTPLARPDETTVPI